MVQQVLRLFTSYLCNNRVEALLVFGAVKDAFMAAYRLPFPRCSALTSGPASGLWLAETATVEHESSPVIYLCLGPAVNEDTLRGPAQNQLDSRSRGPGGGHATLARRVRTFSPSFPRTLGRV
jgi:hypothetical protein